MLLFFPAHKAGPLEHVIAAKAVAFGEALSDEYKEYMKHVKAKRSGHGKSVG